MNVFYNGNIFFNVKTENVSCIYFCTHFYKGLKKKGGN